MPTLRRGEVSTLEHLEICGHESKAKPADN